MAFRERKARAGATTTRAAQYACLGALVVYTSGSSFLMHASRRRTAPGGGDYMVSTSIFIAELGKLAISWGMELRRLRKQDGYVAMDTSHLSPLAREGGAREAEEKEEQEEEDFDGATYGAHPTDRRWTSLCRRMTREMLHQDCMTLSLTALLYTLQYSLQLTSLSVITPATHQALMQNKVLATSLLSACLLGRSYRWQQWASIAALCTGITVLSLFKSKQHTTSSPRLEAVGGASADFSLIWLAGVGSVVAASFFGSGGAVLVERILKNGRASLWMRNVQLAFFGVLISAGAVCLQCYYAGHYQPLRHFDTLAWSATLARCLGGFLIALVLQTSDAVMKGISTSIAMILSLFVEHLAYQYRVSPAALLGGLLVLISSYTYTRYDSESH